MSCEKYSNFVRPSWSNETTLLLSSQQNSLSGDQARKLYLEEVSGDSASNQQNRDYQSPRPEKIKCKRRLDTFKTEFKDKYLFLSAQNNDIDTLVLALDTSPDKINVLDNYGWSLLMIACQANSVEAVQELLKRGANISIRDKAGNSARSLVIKNKNLILADLLLNYTHNDNLPSEIPESESKTLTKVKRKTKHKKAKLKEQFSCEFCNNQTFPNKEEHLSSTVHNINASKGRKIPTNFVIPASNRGYQLMLKEGWDKESGLGPDGTGEKYPIKAVQKKDRKGLGHQKKKEEIWKEDKLKYVNKKMLAQDHLKSKRMEVNFRREFY